MQKSIHNFLAASLVAVGALSAALSTSSAQSLDLYIGPDGRPGLELRDRDRDRRYYDDEYERLGCSERQALRRALRLGVRDPEIQAVTRRQIIIDGERRGRFVTVAFANRPGCPRIG
ncbi:MULTISPECIES: hypothetical protein [unclassified Ensifer]|uniref:hypothetical protein n=1 Tax=unclassified Ensifer TaxID=2633371 RepID=UPI000813D72D|nr:MULTISPECIES: hypothetical protein [unclassified Ensifer]OCP24862.1 hypothetical protein BC361_19870 [Ensifer sp. LC54]OCP25799.1 hypothetical protein BC363_18665 [Ensifer sp. LC384]